MSSDVCPSCGASAVTEESGDGFSRVCTACGAVLDAAPLRATGFSGGDDGLCFVSSTSRNTLTLCRARGERGARFQCLLREGLTGNRRLCNDWIKQMATKVNMDSVMVQQACDIFNKRFIKQPFSHQMALAAASCYQVLRENGRTISLPALAQMAQCTGPNLFQAIRTVTEDTGTGTMPARLQDLLPEAAQAIDPSERAKVVSRATALLEPLRCCWFFEGRAPRCVGPALIFIAWKSLDVDHQNVSYATFCNMHGLGKPTSSLMSTLSDLNKVLVQMASHIPWIKGKKLSANTVLMYVPDIIRYSASLVMDATSSAASTSTGQTGEQRSAVVYKMFRKGRKRTKMAHDYAAEVADCDGNEDISDSEIDLLIRNEQEVKVIEAFLESRKRKNMTDD
ncbi:transcription factor IIIB 50 kDa subunit-like [Dermacentor variabilis]|uniref:transcription factor IIIB 50 kDa subunit-like n=1 Tax=Dermacentor variabilis TaxID=34621 RepID=UPI003F5B58FB